MNTETSLTAATLGHSIECTKCREACIDTLVSDFADGYGREADLDSAEDLKVMNNMAVANWEAGMSCSAHK